MSFDDRFEGLDEELAEIESEDAEETTAEEDAGDDALEATADVEEKNAREDPAFAFDATKQIGFYAREASEEEFVDVWDFEIQRILRKEYGLENVAKREATDALLRLAADHPDLVSDYILRAREDAHGPLGDDDE